MAAIDDATAARSQHGPKLRSRKHGAAIPLDELDKRLLNLMQGSFPIAPRPYRHVAAQAGITEEEVMARVSELLERADHPPGHADLRHARARLRSMLVAAKVDPENPWRAANVINEHPGVSHNYLRNHEFNIWFTIATEPDSPLGLEGTLEVLARIAGAESIRQLPTLKLFKIRMDLEMEGGTDALAKAAEARRAGRDRAPALRRARHRGDPCAAGRHAGDRRAVRARPRRRWGSRRSGCWRISSGMQERRLLRRVAAILSTAAPASAPTGWACGRSPTSGSWSSARGWRRSAGSRTATSARPTPDWPYSVFTMAHGRSKEECDAILDSIAAETGITERATLYSSTEFKKIRLLYFTDEYRAWEREHAGV